MTNKDASVIIGNIPIEGDDCYTIAEYQEAKARAIQALEAQPTHGSTYGGVSWGGAYKEEAQPTQMSLISIESGDAE